jgi:hypothetical protein
MGNIGIPRQNALRWVYLSGFFTDSADITYLIAWKEVATTRFRSRGVTGKEGEGGGICGMRSSECGITKEGHGGTETRRKRKDENNLELRKSGKIEVCGSGL